MKGAAWCSVGVFLAGCAGGDAGNGGGDASSGPVLSGSPDAGSFKFSGDAAAEAGPLLIACDPNTPTSCPAGFLCYAQHTSPSWWVDLYGACTFDCSGQTYALCDSLGGVCGCPVPQGATAAPDSGTPMVCVPGLKPGSSPGANDADGGCGTPGCGGGAAVEAGAPPVADAAGD